ncbi:MAG: leucyl/phenylalanyl-tRNA--protein transferase [bacterium]|nr:leucyl/phenylalanyl-tRNA--protein transferase [bacterium]
MSLFKQIMAELESGQRNPVFPEQFVPDEYGFVCEGGDLSFPMIFEAYTKGCFPWSGDDPIPWYSPDPRLILLPGDFFATRNIRKLKNRFEVRFDCNFRAVMENCASIPRRHEDGTWITSNMIDAYCELHEHHIAHSVEVYDKGELCGGLYGLTFGRSFFGESMFSRASNSSKFALYTLCRVLLAKKFHFIDCQAVTPHLISLGAVPVSRKRYLAMLRESLKFDSLHESWEGTGESLKFEV